MSLIEDYLKLAKLYGLGDRVTSQILTLMIGARSGYKAYCVGFKLLRVPSLPSPEDIRVLRRTSIYAKKLKRYIRIIEGCSRLYLELSKLGVEAWDAFYLYHLADIASTRLSGFRALGRSFNVGVVDVIIGDLKNVELSLYSMLSNARWLLGPLIAGYEHSQAYKAIVDMLRSEGYNLEAFMEWVSSVEVPRVREELLGWIKSEIYTIYIVLRPVIARKSGWRAKRSRRDMAEIAENIVRKLRGTLGDRVLEKARDILSAKITGPPRGTVLCHVARDAADYSGLYTYLLVSMKPLSYIHMLWRPPQCPYPGFKWPLDALIRDYALGVISDEQLQVAIKDNVRLTLGVSLEIPEEVVDRYSRAVSLMVSRLLAGMS